MAQLETVVTGARVEVRIRGRVFRYAPKQKQQAQPSKERRRVCVLSAHAGRMLEAWGEGQPCQGGLCTHSHQTRDEVMKLVRDGVLRFIPGSSNNVATYTYGRTWRGVDSNGAKVMQLVAY